MSKKREREHVKQPVLEEEVTKPDLQMPPLPRPPRLPQLDLLAIESELGWWEAITRSDVRLLEAWLAHHGGVIVSARTVERYDAFFREVADRRSIEMTDHDAGFVLRRRA